MKRSFGGGEASEPSSASASANNKTTKFDIENGEVEEREAVAKIYCLICCKDKHRYHTREDKNMQWQSSYFFRGVLLAFPSHKQTLRSKYLNKEGGPRLIDVDVGGGSSSLVFLIFDFSNQSVAIS